MKHHVYVGTYMDAGGEGICLLELDTEAGTLIPLSSWPGLSRDPAFLSVEGDFLYAVSEGMDHGTVTAFRRDRKTGYITYLNHRDTEGTAMCHLLRWKDKPILSAANYGSGSLLTPTGKTLMDTYDRFCDHLNQEARQLYSRFFDPAEWN